jgi:hypothetical protein
MSHGSCGVVAGREKMRRLFARLGVFVFMVRVFLRTNYNLLLPPTTKQ